jgi:uncharacterized protein YjdB
MIAVVLVLVTACDDEREFIHLPPPVVDVTVTPTEAAIPVGVQLTMLAHVENDSTGEYSGVRWSSDKPAVAVVDSVTGVVTGVGHGLAKVTATSRYGHPPDTASALITIIDGIVDDCLLMVVPSTATISTGQRIQLVVPCDIQVRWSSSDENVVTVDASGFITGGAPGKAVVTATAGDDPTKTARSVITVTGAGQ